MSVKTLVDTMLEEEQPMESDPNTLALRAAWLDWEHQMRRIRSQMLSGSIDAQAAELMAEQASQVYADVERRVTSLTPSHSIRL
jgi:hypothetical protein